MATLAYFHLFFFDILKDNLICCGIRLERKTIVSNHIDKSPILKFTSNKNEICCELGDLFLVCKSDNSQKGIAIQAKNNSQSYTSQSTKNEILLYSNWPKFRIKKPKIDSYEYVLKNKIDSISRFLTFFPNINGEFKIGDAINQNIDFSDFLMELLSPNNNTGRLFRTSKQLRVLKLKRLLDKIAGLKHHFFKESFDDWDLLCNRIMVYFEYRQFKNINTGLNNKQKITDLCFISGTPPETLDKIIEKITEYEFFSLIKLSYNN